MKIKADIRFNFSRYSVGRLLRLYKLTKGALVAGTVVVTDQRRGDWPVAYYGECDDLRLAAASARSGLSISCLRVGVKLHILRHFRLTNHIAKQTVFVRMWPEVAAEPRENVKSFKVRPKSFCARQELRCGAYLWVYDVGRHLRALGIYDGLTPTDRYLDVHTSVRTGRRAIERRFAKTWMIIRYSVRQDGSTNYAGNTWEVE